MIAAIGKAFCTGQAINPDLFDGGAIDLGLVLEKYFNALLELINTLPKVIISAVNGVVAGAGASLVLL